MTLGFARTQSGLGWLAAAGRQTPAGDPGVEGAALRVAVFTDNDFSKTCGVTTSLEALLRFNAGRVEPRVYTAADVGVETATYCAKESLGIRLPWDRNVRVYWPRLWAFARELQQQRVDLVHITTPGPVGLAARWIALHVGRPLTGSLHSEPGQYAARVSASARAGRIIERYVRWFYAPCGSLFVPSEVTRARLALRGYGRDRLHVWGPGVDAEQFAPRRVSPALRQRWHADDRRPAILYAGRLSGEKGLGLVRAIRRGLLQRGLEHQFVFAGDGPMRQELESVCPDGHFLGALGRDQLAVAMASAHVFLFPGATDTLGHVVLEAQASGLPVVVSSQGGPRQHMQPGVTGLVADAGEADGFVTALVTLLTRPAERVAMGQRARQYAASRDWPTALAPLFSGWRDAVRRRTPDSGPPVVAGRAALVLDQESSR